MPGIAPAVQSKDAGKGLTSRQTNSITSTAQRSFGCCSVSRCHTLAECKVRGATLYLRSAAQEAPKSTHRLGKPTIHMEKAMLALKYPLEQPEPWFPANANAKLTGPHITSAIDCRSILDFCRSVRETR